VLQGVAGEVGDQLRRRGVETDDVEHLARSRERSTREPFCSGPQAAFVWLPRSWMRRPALLYH
jgi:hypothetical protein